MALELTASSFHDAGRQAGVGCAPPSSEVETVAPLIGATPSVSAGDCRGLMRPEEVTHMADR